MYGSTQKAYFAKSIQILLFIVNSEKNSTYHSYDFLGNQMVATHPNVQSKQCSWDPHMQKWVCVSIQCHIPHS